VFVRAPCKTCNCKLSCSQCLHRSTTRQKYWLIAAFIANKEYTCMYTLKIDPQTRSRMQTTLRRKLTKHRVRLRNQRFEVSTGSRAPTATTLRNFFAAGVKGRLSGFRRCMVGVAEVSSGALAGAHNAARTVEAIESCLAEGDAKTCIRH
jgi:hypothetical protein